MLSELIIRDFAIIDELQLNFTGGLTVISGETGAGKSILVGAVGLLLGERASSDMIRSGRDEAVVEAFFDISGQDALRRMVDEMGFGKDDALSVRRMISRSGKNRVYINGRIGTLANLVLIGEALIHVCGQNSHQTILYPDNQIDIMDEFGGLLPLREDFRKIYDDYRQLIESKRLIEEKQRHRVEREDMLSYRIDEISRAEIVVGEDTLLVNEKNVLVNIQRLSAFAQSAYDALYGRSASVLSGLHEAVAMVKEIKKIDPSLELSDQEMDEYYYRLEDAARVIRDYSSHLAFDPLRLEEIEERLEALNRLKKKYGGTLSAVLEKLDEAKTEMEAMAIVADEITGLTRLISEQKERLRKAAQGLSMERRRVSLNLTEAMEKEIRSLKMENARFEIIFHEQENSDDDFMPGGKGIDYPEFYFSANAGEAPKPLRNVASGGELSRMMLAFKKVLAATGSVGTIVFDEVDSGIGGATAEIVGRKLQEVARSHQVICITHLPQIAVRGERHYLVAKNVVDGRTSASVSVLSDSERVEEIARMLGGVEMTQKTREHAREMLLAAR